MRPDDVRTSAYREPELAMKWRCRLAAHRWEYKQNARKCADCNRVEVAGLSYTAWDTVEWTQGTLQDWFD